MKYDISEKYNCAVIELNGNVLGGPHADKFREDLHNLIQQGRKNVIVDIGKVKFMNSSGLGILIGGLTTMRNAGGDLRICRADKKVESLLMVTHLTTIFKHYKTLDEAVQSYNEG
ncbi:MAG: STAS domain-containing protein [Cyclonatronaceae bacterium]